MFSNYSILHTFACTSLNVSFCLVKKKNELKKEEKTMKKGKSGEGIDENEEKDGEKVRRCKGKKIRRRRR